MRAGRGEKLPGNRGPGRRPASGGPQPTGRETASAARRIIAPSETRIRTLAHAIGAGILHEIIGGWLRTLANTGRPDELLTAIAIDGKWLRGVADGQVKLFAAMLQEEKVMIGQVRIPDETTETTQVKELLDTVDLENAVVTADAAHACRETAEYIAETGIGSFATRHDSWPCGTMGGQTPNLMLGLAGIGLFYLRFYNPDIPSILEIHGKP